MNSIISKIISKKNNILFLISFLIFSKIFANQKGDKVWEKRIPISVTGIVQPYESLKIQSSVGGRVVTVNVVENEKVYKDQILLILKNENQKQQLKVAELQLKKNQINLEDSKQQIILSKMKVDTSKNKVIDSERQLKVAETQIMISTNAVKDQQTNLKDINRRLKDEQTLYEQGSSTKSQLDSLQLQKDRGLLALDNAKLNLLRSKQDLEGSKISLENAKISLKVSEQEHNRLILSSENAEISLKLSEQEILIRKDALEDTYVKSKINGIVVTKNVEEGGMIGGGSDLFTIINLKKIEVVFEVSESDLPNIELNRPIIFSTPSYPSLYFKAKIQRISWTSNPETGLFAVFALGENKDNLLRIGMSAKIYLLNLEDY